MSEMLPYMGRESTEAGSLTAFSIYLSYEHTPLYAGWVCNASE